MAAAIPLIGAVAGIGSTIFSSARAGKQQKSARRAQATQRAEIDQRRQDQSRKESALKNLLSGGRGKGLLAFNEEADDGLGSTFG